MAMNAPLGSERRLEINPKLMSALSCNIFENSNYSKDTLERDEDAGRNFEEEEIFSLFLKLSFNNKHFQHTDTNLRLT